MINSDNHILIKEKQRFPKWLLLITSLPTVISVVVVYRYVENGEYSSSMIGLGVALLVVMLMSIITLETTLSASEISVRFFPFYRKPTVISFTEIESIEVITYKPIWEYGGWGLKTGKKGVAYSVSGKNGILITFKEPRKLFMGKHKTMLIGTQKPEDWREALKGFLQ